MNINLFSIPANDQSVFYLTQIFGNISGVLPGQNAPLLMGLMFKVLNTAALSAGAMIVVYTTIAGLLATASEGEFLGKKWSGLWVPVRTVLGIVGLFPSSGGYCAIQIILMWLILQGVGLADTLWTNVMVFLAKQGSVTASVQFPDINTSVTTPMQQLFTGLVCYESLAATYERGISSSNPPYTYLCIRYPNDSRCGVALPALDKTTSSYDLGAACGGKVALCDSGEPDPKNFTACIKNSNSTDCINALKNAPQKCYDKKSIGCILCQAQRQVMPGIVSTLDDIAKQFVKIDYEYQTFYNFSTAAKLSETPEWIQDFCNDQGLQNKCCTSFPPTDPKQEDPCSRDTFEGNYPPEDSTDKGSVNADTLKQIYVKYGILPYTDQVDFITAAVNQYVGALTEVYTNYITTRTVAQEVTAGWQRDASANGWVVAGMYYFTIVKQNAAAQPKLSDLPTFSFSVPSPMINDSSIKDNRNNITVMPHLFEALSKASGDDTLSAASSPALSAVSTSTWRATSSMLSSFMADVTGKGAAGRVDNKMAESNVLYRISNYGYGLMIGMQILFWTTVTVVTGLAIWMSLNFTLWGTGMTLPIPWEVAKAIWGLVSPFWVLMISALFSIGAILGIYIPLIPYVIFTMGAVGWFMATVEAMVAGPLIALGILSPSGQHELLGKSEPAVMIIFNLILRPSLMVFGMMASMLVAVVVVTLINQGFVKVAFDIINAPGLVEGVMFMIAYTSLLMMALNKVFSLIHVVPEKVLTYIGGQAISYGESEGLAGMKQAMEGGAGAIAGAGKEAGGALAAGAQKIGQDEAHKAEYLAQQAEQRRKDEEKKKLTGKEAT